MQFSGVLTRQAAPIWAAVVAAPFLLLVRPEFVEIPAAVLFVLSIWVGLFPSIVYLLESKQRPIPLVPLVGLFYVIFFALPPFLVRREWWLRAGSEAEPFGITFETISTFTAALVFLGLGAATAAYYLCERLPLERLPALRFSGRYSRTGLRLVFWGLGAAHLVFLYLSWLRSISSLAQAATPVGFLAVGALFVAWQRGEMRDLEKVGYWGVLIPLEVFIHFYDGLLTPIILLFVFLLGLYWYVRQKLGVIFLLSVLAAIYVFPVLKLSNTFVTDRAAPAGSRIAEKIDALGLASGLISGSAKDSAAGAPLHPVADKNVAAPILRRLALVVLLQYAVDWTPERLPYLGGETLRNLVTNPVPRLLWKDKPEEVIGQWFGHRYRILFPEDQVTSINLPWLVEFYINFGPVGVFVGMAMVGTLIAILERVFLRTGSTDLELVTGWALVFRLFYQESNISLMLGGFITQAVFLILLVHFVLRFLRPRA